MEVIKVRRPFTTGSSAYGKAGPRRRHRVMKTTSRDRIHRSPRYPFVDVGRAIEQARALWKTAGTADASVAGAWKSWGYGPNSSGAIQTEAALKQFGLLDVVGRGKHRRVKLSPLGVEILESGPDSPQRAKSIEKAALLPPIHQHLWERWRTNLPQGEVQIYLVQHRGFQQKGAEALVAEYRRTMSFLDSLRGGRQSTDFRAHLPDQSARGGDTSPSANEFFDLRFEGDQLVLSARVDRRGIPNLIRILRANQPLVGGASKAENASTERPKRRPK